MKSIVLSEFAAGRLLGTREVALPIRDQVTAALDAGETVALHFAGTNPTQSFVDELVGVLVLERGESVLDHLVMKGCNEDTKAILHFVVGDRLDQLAERTALA